MSIKYGITGNLIKLGGKHRDGFTRKDTGKF